MEVSPHELYWIDKYEKKEVISTRIIGGPTMWHINPPVRCDDLKQLWKAIILEHSAFRSFFYKVPKTNKWERGTYKEEEVDDLIKWYFIDQSGISVEQQIATMENARTFLLYEMSGCRWRCFIGKTEKYNQTLTLIIDHTMFDGHSFRILNENLESGITQLEKTGKIELKKEVHSVLQFSNSYADYMLSLPPHHLEFWRTLLREPVFYLPPQDGNPLSDQPRISIIKFLPLSIASQFHNYLRQRKISAFTGALTLTLVVWRKLTGQTHGIIPITTHGRKVPTDRRDFIGRKFDVWETLGNLTCSAWVKLSLGDASFEEVAKKIGEQLVGIGEKSVEYQGLSLLRQFPHLDVPTTNEKHANCLSFNFMQTYNSKRFETVPGLLESLKVRPENKPKPVPNIRIWWRENSKGINLNLFYNEQFHSKSVAHKVIDAILYEIGLHLEKPHSNL